MAKVTGLGGVFFKSDDAARLVAFYRDALGMNIEAWGGAQLFADEVTGPRFYSVWCPFPSDTRYFDPSARPFMLNLRVDDLDGVLARAREAGAVVLDRREDTPQGRFGYVVDPDGTLIELFQPAPDEPASP